MRPGSGLRTSRKPLPTLACAVPNLVLVCSQSSVGQVRICPEDCRTSPDGANPKRFGDAKPRSRCDDAAGSRAAETGRPRGLRQVAAWLLVGHNLLTNPQQGA